MSTGKLQALVADDDPDVLRMICEAVVEFGAEVTRAATGDELIELLAERRFDLVVTDVSMPWMTGLQVLHSVRTAGLTTPTVVITALRDARIARQVVALGRDATLLYKPFGLTQLFTAIGSVLDVSDAPASRPSGA